MDKQWFDLFSNRDYWEDIVQKYVETGTVSGRTAFAHITELWDYFKFCMLTDNRFFFSHPLLDVVKGKINEHVNVLPANTTLFRARLDSGNSLRDKSRNLLQVKILTDLKEKAQVPENAEYDKMIVRFRENYDFETYNKQQQRGFEGYPEDECMSPPAHMVSHGRCNLPYLPHLYAAADIHTAVVETRPYIHDTISVASICCEKDLRIVDFCFDWNDQDHLYDWFYLAMSSEFSAVNKGKEKDYFATQYLTMLVKSLGYDGLKFKSSLVVDGTNYVIFDDSAFKPISSKLYIVAQARYDLLPVSNDLHLKDADCADVPDPPLAHYNKQALDNDHAV